MNESRNTQEHERTLIGLISDIRDELSGFVQTRARMFAADLQETLRGVRSMMPLAAMAMMLFSTAFLLFSLAVVGFVAMAFPDNPYRWPLAFVVVTVLWAMGGGVMVLLAKNRLRAREMFPKRTIEVLKADKIWLQGEAKTI